MVTPICSKSMDQLGNVANPARGQLNRGEIDISMSSFATGNLVTRDGLAVPSRVNLLISILRLNLVLTHGISPELHGGVHLLF